MLSLLGHRKVKKHNSRILLSVIFSAPAAVASAESGSPVTDMVTRGATGLALCLAVFGVAVFVMKRTSSKLQTSDREIIIKERVAISAKTSAVLVEVKGQTYLMVTGSENTSISQIPSSDYVGTQQPVVLPSEGLFRVSGE